MTSTNILTLGRHFDEHSSARQVGHKALAVGVSEMAAMGVHPQWATLKITNEQPNDTWMQSFIKGFMQLANQFHIAVTGVDSNQDSLSISVTVMAQTNSPLLNHSQAQRGDLIAVTGQLGSAACAFQNRGKELDQYFDEPEPQLQIAENIKEFAHACVNVSGGLLTDLERICQASGLGAKVALEHIPVHPLVKQLSSQWSHYAINGQEDHQLCFTFNPKDMGKLPINCSVIGQMGCGKTVSIFANNKEISHKQKGLLHFNQVNI